MTDHGPAQRLAHDVADDVNEAHRALNRALRAMQNPPVGASDGEIAAYLKEGGVSSARLAVVAGVLGELTREMNLVFVAAH